MLCWSNNKPTNVGRYWCWLNNQSIIVRIWKSTIDGKLITNGGTSIKDHYYKDALWWSEEIKSPDNPKT